MKNYLAIAILLLSLSCNPVAEEERLMTGEVLDELISKKEKSLIYIWTTWCSGCRKSLKESLPKLHQDLDSSQYQIILIAASKDVKEVDSLVKQSGLEKHSYLIDFMGPDRGKFQSLGIQQFLFTNFSKEKIYSGGIPVFFMVDKNKDVLLKNIPHSYNEAMEAISK